MKINYHIEFDTETIVTRTDSIDDLVQDIEGLQEIIQTAIENAIVQSEFANYYQSLIKDSLKTEIRFTNPKSNRKATFVRKYMVV